MTDEKFRLKMDILGTDSCNDIKLKIVDEAGQVIDQSPVFYSFDISAKADDMLKVRVEMAGRHLDLEGTVTVGTLGAFTSKELREELEGRDE